MNNRGILSALSMIVLSAVMSLAATQTVTQAKYLGVRTLNAGTQTNAAVNRVRRMPFYPKPKFAANVSGPVTPSPTVAGVPVVGPGTDFFGFNGMTALTSGLAQGFTLEPPDQGLAVGDAQVVEAINLALTIYSRKGVLQAGPISFYDFLSLDPNTQFLSDPRVFFDQDTQRWFITILDFALNSSGQFAPPAFTYVAVSQQASALGQYSLYAFEVTDAAHSGCPCFGDQPLAGFNGDGLFLSTNEFSFSSGSFQTALVLATSKHRLASGTPGPVVAFQNMSAGGMPGFSLQPANRAAATNTEINGGSEFLLSSLDPEGYADNRLVVWALTNTESLDSEAPTLTLASKVVTTETYIQSNVAPQKNGPTPLRDALNNADHLGDPLEMLNPDDDRMQQVIFAGGRLYGTLTTTLLKPTGGYRDGVAWFVIQPGSSIEPFNAQVVAQGYLAAPSIYLLYPAIAVNSSGQGIIAFSMSGTNIFPSAGYSKFFGGLTEAKIHLATPGAAPEDGFSGYFEFGGNGVTRWGDYSAATIAPDGSSWFATEYIPNLPRTTYTNFGTEIGSVHTP